MAVKIDSDGYYVPGSDLVGYIGEQTNEIITAPVPGGLWKPYWDGLSWKEGLTPEEIALTIGLPTENWDKLVVLMRESQPFFKLFSVAQEFNERGVRTNAIFTLLMSTLTSTNNLNDLNFCLSSLPHLMLGIYTAQDIDFINKALAETGFKLYVNSI